MTGTHRDPDPTSRAARRHPTGGATPSAQERRRRRGAPGDPSRRGTEGDPGAPAGWSDPAGGAAEGDPDGLAPAGRDALEAFVAHLRDERGLSAHTVAAYRRDLTQFLQFGGRAGVTDPAEVEPLLLRRFLALQRT